MVVNPVDYLTKVLPAMSFRTPSGEYVNILPYPTDIVQEVTVPKGKAILGIAKRYLLGASSADIKAYKEVMAKEDMDLHIGKIYSNGRPEDNVSFIVVDISSLKSLPTQVEVIANTPAMASLLDNETLSMLQDKIEQLETEIETVKNKETPDTDNKQSNK